MKQMQQRITDLDYFFANDGIVYYAKGYKPGPDGVIACPVFWPDPNGDRLHPERGRYRKEVSDFNEHIFERHPTYRSTDVPRHLPRIPWHDVERVLSPRERFEQFLEDMHGTAWHRIAHYLMEEIGVPKGDIGVFGSYLVGLNRDARGSHIKDVDFVIYGLANYRRVRAQMNRLREHFNFGPISAEHIAYHAQKFGAQFDPSVNDFKLTLANKWCSMQIAPGILNTLRFAYKSYEIPPDPLWYPIAVQSRITGIVTYDDRCNFTPRCFALRTDNGACTVVTYAWAFQSCVKRGDRVIVTGNAHSDGCTISVDSPSHGIRIIG